MAKGKNPATEEKFKTMIGGQALIEGIMMRGPDKDAVTVRKDGQIHVEVKQRKLLPEKSVKTSQLYREPKILKIWSEYTLPQIFFLMLRLKIIFLSLYPKHLRVVHRS